MNQDRELLRKTWTSLEETCCYNCEYYYEGAVCGHTLEYPEISTDELRKRRKEIGCGLELLAPKDKLELLYGK